MNLKQIIHEEVRRQLREFEEEPQADQADAINVSQPVQMAIDKIKNGPVMSTLSKISNDTQKAQLIMKFAELIGVPKNKLTMVLSTLKKSAV